MAITAQDRVKRLRQAAAHGRRYPDDLFEARMAIHDAFDGADTNHVCELLLPRRPPLSERHCVRLEMAADRMDSDPEANAEALLGFCDVIRMMTPY